MLYCFQGLERYFRTLKERWLYGLDLKQIQSLDEFNELLAAYIRKHNTTIHSATGETPLSRYLHSGHPIRLTDRVEDGKTKRENQVAIDYGTALGGGRNVH